MPVRDFSSVTETTDVGLSREAIAMHYHRYRFARDYSLGKDVLEVACGGGQGLGYLALAGKRIVGGDYTFNLLRQSKTHYGKRIPLVNLDGHQLPFGDHSFDVVLLFEAIYYLEKPERFLSECRRVLRPGGLAIVGTINKEWADFNPSPFSSRYFTASELGSLFIQQGFSPTLYAAFPAAIQSLRHKVVSHVKRLAVKLHLIPSSMKSKEWLKRIFFGTLTHLPREVFDGMALYESPVQISGSQANQYKVIYVIGR